MYEVEMISLDELVPASHNYRKFKKIWNFKSVGSAICVRRMSVCLRIKISKFVIGVSLRTRRLNHL